MERISVMAGGMIGAALRVAIDRSVSAPDLVPQGFPLSTWLVNLAGCFALGLLFAGLADAKGWPRHVRLMFGTGLLGSFTTFSAFAAENLALWESGHFAVSIVYTLSGIVMGTALAAAGAALAGIIKRPRT